jgi:uncharacterized integral membrane protein (TIGR00698 family)
MNRLIIFHVLVLLAFFGIAPHWSILAGVVLSFVLKLSVADQRLIKTWSSRILQASIVLLGAALNFQSVLKQGVSGLLVTFFSIAIVLGLGEMLARLFQVSPPLSHLISVGTAICGGSAIGAVSPVLKADNLSIATAMGVVFLLNAVAVFTLPWLGHQFGLSQIEFGNWAALAIHDTSAVVAASAAYGEEALGHATTLKLTRALWIIPVALLFTFRQKGKTQMSYPWFILFFLAMSVLFTFLPQISDAIPLLKMFAKNGFTITLFLIGLSLNKEQLLSIGTRTIGYGVTLWLLTLILSFFYVVSFHQGSL